MLAGYLELRLSGAFPEECISRLAKAQIPLLEMRREDAQNWRIWILRRDLNAAEQIARKSLCTLDRIRISGLLPAAEAMGLRIVFPALLLLLFLSVFRLQEHLLFFQVTGAETLPGEQILQTLEGCGVGLGTDAGSLDLNQLKNRMLSELPQLRFFTVNTEGPYAEISVREREEKPVLSREAAPADLVAGKDGLVLEGNAENGQLQVHPGDLVKAGDVLISGIRDLERTTLLTRAAGEVYARTWNQMESTLPENRMAKAYTGRTKVRYGIRFGKNTIKNCKTSSISYDSYDKISQTRSLTLPGGLELPVYWIQTVYREYHPVPAGMDREEAEALLLKCTREALCRSMQAGRILSEDPEFSEHPDGLCLREISECREEIGRTAELTE